MHLPAHRPLPEYLRRTTEAGIPRRFPTDTPVPPPTRWQRVRQVFTRTPFEERWRIVAIAATLEVHADDDGTLEVQLSIANLSRRRMTIKRFHCEQWFWNGAELPGMEPHFRGIGTRVPRRGFAECTLTFQLGAGTVRRIRDATQPAANVYSSVDARVEVFGRLWFERRKEPLWLYLTPPNAVMSTPWR